MKSKLHILSYQIGNPSSAQIHGNEPGVRGVEGGGYGAGPGSAELLRSTPCASLMPRHEERVWVATSDGASSLPAVSESMGW